MTRPFIPVPNVASFEMIYNVNGIIAENIIHIRRADPYTLADLQDMREVINDWDSDSWKNLRATSVYLTRIRGKALDTEASPVEDYPLPTARPGTSDSRVVSQNVTFCVKLSTGLTGRSQRGRLYVIGMMESALAANTNQVTSVYAGLVVTYLNDLLDRIADADGTLGVVSYRHDGEWRAEGQFTPAVNWVAVDLNVDSQRRRLTGRGE
jgi:hypothetical protein